MSAVLTTMAKLIEMVHSGTISYFFPVIFVAFFGKMLNFIFSRNVFRSMKKQDVLYEQIVKIREHGKKNKKIDVSREIVSFLGTERYPMTGFFSVFLLEAAVGLLLSLVFRSAELYLYDVSLAYVAVIDLRLDMSLFQAVVNHVPSMILASTLLFTVTAIALHYFFMQRIEDGLVVEQNTPNLIALLLLAAGCILLPSAFCVYWIASKLLDYAQLILEMKVST